MLLSQLYLFWMSNQTSHYVSLKITLSVVHNDFLPFSPLYRNGWAGNISQYVLKKWSSSPIYHSWQIKSITHWKSSCLHWGVTESLWVAGICLPPFFSYFPSLPVSWCFLPSLSSAWLSFTSLVSCLFSSIANHLLFARLQEFPFFFFS